MPREMLGTSTFGVAMKLLKWLPTKVVDRFLLIMAKMMIGDTEKYGLKRPKVGPLELKNTTGKTPVLDVGALSLIKDERIKVLECTENPHRRFLDFLILLIVFFFPLWIIRASRMLAIDITTHRFMWFIV